MWWTRCLLTQILRNSCTVYMTEWFMHVVLIDPYWYMLWCNRLDFFGVYMSAFVLTLRSSSCVMSGNLTVVHCKEWVKKKNSVQAVYRNNFGIFSICCAEPTWPDFNSEIIMCSWFWYGNFGTFIFWGGQCYVTKRKIKCMYTTHQSSMHVNVIVAIFEGISVEIA
jgi:hypothetical protein